MEKRKFFYGWIVLFGCFLIMSVLAVFIYNTWTFYQMPVSEGLGVSYVAFSATNSISSVAIMIFSILLASKVTSGKTRLFMLFGGVTAGAMWVLNSFVTQIWQLYVLYFIASLAISATLYIPINSLIANWFEDKKGLATSLCFCGGGIGGVLFNNLIAKNIATRGWQYSFRISGIIAIAVALVAFLLIRKTPAEMGLEPYRVKKTESAENPENAAAAAAARAAMMGGLTKKEAVKTSAFWMLAIVMVCCGIIAAGITTQLPTFLTECGMDFGVVMTFFSAIAIVSTLSMGPLVDKSGLTIGAAIASVLLIVSMVSFIMASSGGALIYVGVACLGFGSAATGSIIPPLLTGKLFGYKEYGAIYGLAYFFFMAGCMVGPVVSSMIRTSLGSYDVAWIFFIVIVAVMMLAVVLAFKASESFSGVSVK